MLYMYIAGKFGDSANKVRITKFKKIANVFSLILSPRSYKLCHIIVKL